MEEKLRLEDYCGTDKGEVGEETNLVDIFGDKLHVGDIVKIISINKMSCTRFVIKEDFDKYRKFKVQDFENREFFEARSHDNIIIIKEKDWRYVEENEFIKSFYGGITVI